MLPGNSALTAALAAGERYPSHTVRLGGKDVSEQVSGWTLDRAYSTDLPDAMKAVTGSASAQLDVSLTGTGGATAPALYGAWAPRSTGDIARPGQSVTQAWGMSGTVLDTFRGTVRSRSAQSGTDLVSLSALDGAERLRMPAVLPRPAGGIDPATPFGAATNWASSTTWCVDHLLRTAGIHSAPPPRAGCILYASLHGGAAADIGSLLSLSGDWSQWTKTSAPHDIAVQGSASGTTAEYVPVVRPVNRGTAPILYFETWLNSGLTGTRKVECTVVWVDSTGKKTYTSMIIDIGDQSWTAAVGANSDPMQNTTTTGGIVGINLISGNFHVGMGLSFTSAGAAVFQPTLVAPNGVQYFEGQLPMTIGSVPAGTVSSVRLSITGVRAEAVQLSQVSTVPTGNQITQNGLWRKAAVLDQPDIPVRVIPQVSGSAWDVITQIAKATLSTAEFDTDGYFRWRSRTRWATTPTTPNVTVTSDRELSALTVTEEIDACRNAIAVQYDNWASVKASDTVANPMGNVQQLTAGQYQEIWWPVGVNDFDTLPPLTASTVGANSIRFVNANTDTATTVFGAVEVGIRRQDGKLFLTLRNRSAATVWMRGATSGALSADVRSPAIPGGGGPAPYTVTSASSASQTAYGVQTYEHQAGGWLQDAVPAQALAGALVTAGAFPCPLLGSISVLPDPRLQLGDIVRVVDTTGASLNTLAWIIGIRISGSGGSISQTLTLRGASYNGTPTDTGLTPDPPIRPGAPLPT